MHNSKSKVSIGSDEGGSKLPCSILIGCFLIVGRI